ncbi:MAG: hypothetical protein P1P87_13635 [Trueperaceae bacterium]|nr:hypothetical protein [Trueperaceae bacterium]
MRSALRTWSLALPLVGLLAACTVTFVPDGDAGATRPEAPTRPIVRPEPAPPTRPGPAVVLPPEGAFLQFEVAPNTIYPGSVLTFRTRLSQAGFLTVSALGPDGQVVVLVRNAPVAVRQQLVPPTGSPPADRVLASAPTGTWRVYAQFATVRTPARYDGITGLEAWQRAIAADLRGIDGASLVEASYEVRRR